MKQPPDVPPPSLPDCALGAKSGALADVKRQMERRLFDLRVAVLEDVDALEGLLDMLPSEPARGCLLPSLPGRQPLLPDVEALPPAPPAAASPDMGFRYSLSSFTESQSRKLVNDGPMVDCSFRDCSTVSTEPQAEDSTGGRPRPRRWRTPTFSPTYSSPSTFAYNITNSLFHVRHSKSEPHVELPMEADECTWPASPRAASPVRGRAATTSVLSELSDHEQATDATPVSDAKLPRSGSAMVTSASSSSLSRRVRAAYDANADVKAALRGRRALLGSGKMMGGCFEIVFGVVILLNALLSGVEVQWRAMNFGHGNGESVVFQVLRHMFTLIFVLEIFMRVRKLGAKEFFCLDDDRAWAWLDVMVVAGGLFELAFDLVLYATFGNSRSEIEGTGIVRNVRLIRLVRLTRAFRLQRIIRFVAALRTLVYSIASTLKSLFWAMVLLAIIVYVFSLAFTMEALDALEIHGRTGEEAEVLLRAWGSLFSTMYTLFQSISGGVSWIDVVEPLGGTSTISLWLFTMYIAFTSFAVLNVVTGVFCSSALETTQRNPDLVARTILDKRKESSRLLQNLFTAIDDDDSGLITLDELQSIASDDMVRAYFQAMDIEFRDAWTLFKLIDTENQGAVKLQDFLMACEQLRGGATNVHISELSYDIRKLRNQLTQLWSMVNARLPLVRGKSDFGF